MSDDPRLLGGDIAGPGGPHDVNAFVVDMTRAVLLDSCTVVRVELQRGGEADSQALAMLLEGRINKSDDRTRVLYVFDEDGAAGIITELWALASRMGPGAFERIMARVDDLVRGGNV